MRFRILTLKDRFKERFNNGRLVPNTAWERQEVITASGYVDADKKAKKKHKNKIVHTYVIDKSIPSMSE